MELLSFINRSSIEGIPLLDLETELNKLQRSVMTNMVIVTHGDRQKNIKCIREYYLNPLDKKKLPKVNIVNPCNSIQGALNVQGCQPIDCKNCHLQMIEKYFSGQAFLIKSNKK